MEYIDTVEAATEFAESALALMEEQAIPPHPNNFIVWYNYFCGACPDLKRALDMLIESKQSFTESRNAQVYRKFVASPLEVVPLPLMAQRMEAELSTVLASLNRTGKQAADYGETLENASGELSGANVAENVRAILSQILDQTHAMAEQSGELEKDLSKASQQIAELRDDLERARKEAMIDSLTGLSNRKVFDTALREATMEALETGEPLCLLFIDVDHFKRFNDSFGHVVGDQVLKLLGTVMRNCIKGQDTAVRYGGEEFAVILPNTGTEGAVTVAESIRRRISSKEIVDRKSGERMGRVTVSIGVAQYEKGESVREFTERVDHALYAAKSEGRNRVVTENGSYRRDLSFGT